ncbi:hypothetical protein EMIT0347P_90206 [Pseudomonas sp. IT-347P]
MWQVCDMLSHAGCRRTLQSCGIGRCYKKGLVSFEVFWLYHTSAGAGSFNKRWHMAKSLGLSGFALLERSEKAFGAV